MSAFVVIALIADGCIALIDPGMLAADAAATGFPLGMFTPTGVIILVSVILYAVPQTSVLGAILVTGFLGGAISVHFRLGEVGSPPQLVCLVLGLLTWGGLYLRDARLSALLPLMMPSAGDEATWSQSRTPEMQLRN